MQKKKNMIQTLAMDYQEIAIPVVGFRPRASAGRRLVYYNSNSMGQASALLIVFKKCTPSEKQRCKSDKEIYEWLEYKYLYSVVNEKKFIKHLFGEERILA